MKEVRMKTVVTLKVLKPFQQRYIIENNMAGWLERKQERPYKGMRM